MTLAPEWEEPFFAGERILLCLGGEGAGKSFTAGLYAVTRSIFDLTLYDEPGLYWIIGQDFQDARSDFLRIADFQEKLDNIVPDGLHSPSDKDQQATLKTKTGQLFTTVSGYDVSKVARETPIGIVGAEFTRWQSEELFQRCEGRLTRNYPLAWGIFTGSYESSLGWVPDLARLGEGPNDRDIRSFSIPSWANFFFYPGGRDDPAIKAAEAGMSADRFMERFGGRPSPPKAVIFHEFRNHVHVDGLLKEDREHPIYLAIDPGDNVYCVLFVQFVAGEVRVIDEIYVSHWTHEQVVNEAKNNKLWPMVKGGAIDIASKQAHMGMPRPISEWYKDTGIRLISQKQAVEDTIELLRVALSFNPNTGRARIRISPKCKGLISEMGGCASPLDGHGPWRRFEGRAGLGPPRNDNNDACKALGYLLGQKQSLLREDKSTAASASYLIKESRNWSGSEFLKEKYGNQTG